MSTAAAVFSAIKTDRETRLASGDPRDAVDLFNLQDCTRHNWDYSLPTMDARRSFEAKLDHAASIERLYQGYPGLVGVDLTNILIAGGAVSNAVTNMRCAKDVDFFIYGIHDTDKAVERIRSLFEAIEAAHAVRHRANFDKNEKEILLRYQNGSMLRPYKASVYPGYEPDSTMVRTQNYVSLHLKGVEYQVILRLYDSKSQILHGFDMGPAAIGFDGKAIWVSSLGRLSYEYGINALDISRRSLSMEYRLKKYFDRGFKLVLPRLDMTKIVGTGVNRFGMTERIMLGNMCIEYDSFIGNHIMHAKIHCKAVSDYAGNIDNEIGVLNANIRALVSNDLDKLTVVKPGKWRYDVFAKKNFFGANFIYSFYLGMASKLKYDGWNIRNLRYFSPAIRERMFAHFVEVLDGGHGSVAKLEYSDFIEEQIKLVFSRVETASKQGIVFRTVDPGAQYTGSFHPVATTEEAFYGAYFLAE